MPYEQITIILVGVPLVLSPIWFAFTRSKRVRWGCLLIWSVVGGVVSIKAFELNVDKYKGMFIGLPIGCLFWASIYWGVGWSVKKFYFVVKKIYLSGKSKSLK